MGVAGGLVDHASPTLLLMSVEESLQLNLNSKYCLIVCTFDFINLTLHTYIVDNPHKISPSYKILSIDVWALWIMVTTVSINWQLAHAI